MNDNTYIEYAMAKLPELVRDLKQCCGIIKTADELISEGVCAYCALLRHRLEVQAAALELFHVKQPALQSMTDRYLEKHRADLEQWLIGLILTSRESGIAIPDHITFETVKEMDTQLLASVGALLIKQLGSGAAAAAPNIYHKAVISNTIH